ncbi:hypothetical protein BH23GEM9_BH23GEM9_15060 [soil metagenome]
MVSKWNAGWLVLALLGACAPATMSDPAGGAGGVQGQTLGGAATGQREMVPAGYGTLRQDDITVSIRSGSVLLKVTPMDEATIRLLAPDTHSRLHALRESRHEEAARNMLRTPELFLVSFFSNEPDVAFQPEDVQLFHQARVLRPQAILPVSSGWGRQRLAQQETQLAVYAFEGPIEYDQSMTVRYGALESDEWRQIITRLENERGKILARVR